METMCRSVTQCEESDTNDEISEDKKGEPEEKKFYQKKWFKYTVYALFALGGAALLTYGIILLYDHAAAKGLLPDYMKYAELYHMGVIYDNTSKYNADEQLASAQWVFNLEWLINDPELKFASIRSRAAELVLRYSMDIEVLKPVKDFLIDNNRCVLMKHVTDKVWHVAAYTHEYILNINRYAKENGWYTLDQFLLAKGIDRTRADWTVPGSEFSKFDMEDGS